MGERDLDVLTKMLVQRNIAFTVDYAPPETVVELSGRFIFLYFEKETGALRNVFRAFLS